MKVNVHDVVDYTMYVLHEHKFLISNMSLFWDIYSIVVYLRNVDIA